MAWIVTKYLITAAVIVIITEIAKRSGKLGALITALPLVAILALIWMFIEQQPASKIGTYATYTFWYVLPTLPMFLAFAPLQSHFGFWWAMAGSVVLTIICFLLLNLILRLFDIDLL